MSKPIRLHNPVANEGAQRLNFVAGRYLSEQEFDLMQGYVDERCDRLLMQRPPGIVEGLELNVRQVATELNVRVQPGRAIGGDGKVIHLFQAQSVDWPALISEHRAQISTPGNTEASPLNGFYLLTLRRRVATVVESDGRDACSRTEPNPLQDSRIETFATIGLQFVHRLPSVMAMAPRRAANRVCAANIRSNVFDADTGAVPLALVKIEEDIPQWVDALAGCYLSEPDAHFKALARHWQNIVNSGNLQADANLNLSSNLGLDFLPSAGAFPDNFISNIAGEQSVDDASLWQTPRLHFAAEDLQIELLPVPANSIEGTLHYEQARGLIDLVHRQVDRIRLMVAVNEEDYRPDLMALPQIDGDLVDDLHQRYVVAASDYNAWANQYLAIYAEMDRDLVFTGDAADEESQNLFDSLFKLAGPAGDFPNIDTPEKREGLKLPVAQTAPLDVATFLDGLITTRRRQLAEGANLPRPYSQYAENLPALPDDLNAVEPVLSGDFQNGAGQRSPGLYRLQTDYKNQISATEDDLEENFELLEEINDFLAVQRQQLDSISVSFAALAGGVQGDGSGLNLMRWTTGANFLPIAQETGGEDNG